MGDKQGSHWRVKYGGKGLILGLLLAVVLAACGQPQAVDRDAGSTAVAPTVSPQGGGAARNLESTPSAALASPTRIFPTNPPRPTLTPSPTFGPSAAVPGLAAALTTVTELHLRNDWDGLSATAPQLAHFDLVKQDEGFTGVATFSAGSSGRQPQAAMTTTSAITIPQPVVTEFLQLLATTQARVGRYVPRIDHTDDYPNLLIELTTAAGPVVFFSQSQGQDHTPWGLSFGGGQYIIDTNIPNRAFTRLNPYLDYETQQLQIDALRFANASPAPGPLALCAISTASPRPRQAAPGTGPQNLVAEYQLEQTYSLVFTGPGVRSSPSTRKLVRDPALLAELLNAMGQPTTRLVAGRVDYTREIILTWRTTDGRTVHFSYDPVAELIAFYLNPDPPVSQQQQFYYAVPPALVAQLQRIFCLPDLPQTGG